MPQRAPRVLGIDEFASHRGRTHRTLFVDFAAGQKVDLLSVRMPEPGPPDCATTPAPRATSRPLKAVHEPKSGILRRWDACRDWPSSSCGRVACSLAWPWSTPSRFRTFRALVSLGSARRVRIGRHAVGARKRLASLRPRAGRIPGRPGPPLPLRHRARARPHVLDRELMPGAKQRCAGYARKASPFRGPTCTWLRRPISRPRDRRGRHRPPPPGARA